MGRDSMGVKGIELREGDRVVGVGVIADAERQQVLAISQNGYGKRTPVSEWRLQSRAGKGIIAMDCSARNGELVKLSLVEQDDQIIVITDGGQIIRTRVSEIRQAGRNTQGVIVIRLREGERVVDVEPVSPEDADEPADVQASSDETDQHADDGTLGAASEDGVSSDDQD